MDRQQNGGGNGGTINQFHFLICQAHFLSPNYGGGDGIARRAVCTCSVWLKRQGRAHPLCVNAQGRCTYALRILARENAATAQFARDQTCWWESIAG
jgi:hypothetical protein